MILTSIRPQFKPPHTITGFSLFLTNRLLIVLVFVWLRDCGCIGDVRSYSLDYKSNIVAVQQMLGAKRPLRGMSPQEI